MNVLTEFRLDELLLEELELDMDVLTEFRLDELLLEELELDEASSMPSPRV